MRPFPAILKGQCIGESNEVLTMINDKKFLIKPNKDDDFYVVILNRMK